MAPSLQSDSESCLSGPERKKNWAAFQRSLEPAEGKRIARASKCPADLVAEIMNDNGEKPPQYWFEKWLKYGRDWGRVQMEERISKTQDYGKGAGWGWVTEKQIEHHYRCPETARAISESLKAQGRSRPNPDAPLCEVATQYWAQLKSTAEHNSNTSHLSSTSLRADAPSAHSELVGSRIDEQFKILNSANSSTPSAPEQSQSQLTPKQIAQREERKKKAAEKAARLEREKMEKERVKDLPESKAAAWQKDLTKEIRKIADLIAEVKASAVPSGLKKFYEDEMNRGTLNLETLKDNLQAVADGTPVAGGAQAVVDSAKSIVDGVHQTAKAWKASKKIHQPAAAP